MYRDEGKFETKQKPIGQAGEPPKSEQGPRGTPASVAITFVKHGRGSAPATATALKKHDISSMSSQEGVITPVWVPCAYPDDRPRYAKSKIQSDQTSLHDPTIIP